jgi:NAD(P)H-hydrate epimerase
LVTVATPDAVLPIVAAAHAECMSEALASTNAGTISLRNLDGSRFVEIEKKKDVLAVGPGLGQDPETQEFIRRIVLNTKLPVILDADGLNAFAGHADKLRERASEFLAITPHPGEMARLRNSSIKEIQAHRDEIALDSARKWNAHVVLKGSHTIIATPAGQLFVNTSGNPGLAKGGTGDVLTGILAGLTAQFRTSDWARVLALGVYLHGNAAELATANTDLSGLLAHDVSNAVPMVRLELLEQIRQRG